MQDQRKTVEAETQQMWTLEDTRKISGYPEKEHTTH